MPAATRANGAAAAAAARAPAPAARSSSGRAPGAAAQLAFVALLHVLAALAFSRGFLLTRVELPGVSSCPGAGCPPAAIRARPATAATDAAAAAVESSSGGEDKAGGPIYDRAVILIVDALRFDFVCENSTAAKPFAGRFPRTLALVADDGGGGDGDALNSGGDAAAASAAATVLRFVADTPTITMSRLKALLTVRAGAASPLCHPRRRAHPRLFLCCPPPFRRNRP